MLEDLVDVSLQDSDEEDVKEIVLTYGNCLIDNYEDSNMSS